MLSITWLATWLEEEAAGLHQPRLIRVRIDDSNEHDYKIHYEENEIEAMEVRVEALAHGFSGGTNQLPNGVLFLVFGSVVHDPKWRVDLSSKSLGGGIRTSSSSRCSCSRLYAG